MLCSHKVWLTWIKFCRNTNNFIQWYFEVHTRFISSHYVAVIVLSLFFVGFMAVGAIWLESLERSEELFIPSGSRAFKDLDRVDELFPEKYRVEEFIVTRPGNNNILNDTIIFKKALELHLRVIALKDFEKSCLTYTDEYGMSRCLFISPLQIFNYTMDKISNVNSALNTWLQNKTFMFYNGRPASLNYPNILGKYKASSDGQTVEYANAFRMIYYTKYVDTVDSNYNTIMEFEESYLDLTSEMKTYFKKQEIILNYYTARTNDDAVVESTIGDLPLFSVAFILMVFFCLVVFLRLKNAVTGHFTVAIFGICVIVLGIACGFGLAMWVRTKFVAFTGILMFLVLGIGMDNMFIMVDAMEAVDSTVKGNERLVVAMKHIGGSITMTTTTDLVAFAVSTISDFPAIHFFCIYAALSIFFAYALLITLFLALLSWDVQRIEKGQRDVCPCFSVPDTEKLENPWEKKSENLSKLIMRKWAELIMTTRAKIVVCIIACGLLAAGIYGTINIKQEFNLKNTARDGSYLSQFVDMRKENFPAGYGVSVVLPKDVDYKDSITINHIIKLDEIAAQNSHFEDYTINWVKHYQGWAKAQNMSIEGDSFSANLQNFLNMDRLYLPDIKFDKNSGTILASRVVFFYEDSDDAINQANAMRTIRKDLETESGIPGIYPISIMFIYSEMFAAVVGDTTQNLIICGIAILLITLPYLMHPGITLLVFLSFISLLFELMGLMAAWNVSLEVIAMVVIIMSIGFSVDYTCHIAHAYMNSHEDTPEKRIVDALTTMGASVLNGGLSTLLGMLITAFSKAEGFRIFFKMMFGIVVLGLLHGLVILPVLLSIFARHDLRADMKISTEHQSQNIENEQNEVAQQRIDKSPPEAVDYPESEINDVEHRKKSPDETHPNIFFAKSKNVNNEEQLDHQLSYVKPIDVKQDHIEDNCGRTKDEHINPDSVDDALIIKSIDVGIKNEGFNDI